MSRSDALVTLPVLSVNASYAHLHVHGGTPIDGKGQHRRKDVELRTWGALGATGTIALHASGGAPALGPMAYFDLPEDMPRSTIVALVRYSIRPAVVADGVRAMIGGSDESGEYTSPEDAIRRSMAKAEKARRTLLAWEVTALAPLDANDARLAFRKGVTGRLGSVALDASIIDGASWI